MTAVANRTTRWCPAHDGEMVKRGTLRCRRCTTDIKVSLTRRRLTVNSADLRPMRGQHTKRSVERITKGYAT